MKTSVFVFLGLSLLMSFTFAEATTLVPGDKVSYHCADSALGQNRPMLKVCSASNSCKDIDLGPNVNMKCEDQDMEGGKSLWEDKVRLIQVALYEGQTITLKENTTGEIKHEADAISDQFDQAQKDQISPYLADVHRLKKELLECNPKNYPDYFTELSKATMVRTPAEKQQMAANALDRDNARIAREKAQGKTISPEDIAEKRDAEKNRLVASQMVTFLIKEKDILIKHKAACKPSDDDDSAPRTVHKGDTKT